MWWTIEEQEAEDRWDLIGACEVSRREDEEENGLESDEDPLLEDADGESSGEDAY